VSAGADAQEIAYIGDSAQLAAVCDLLAAREWIAVDTEFMRDSSYYPLLCCVQLAVPGRAWLVDTIAFGGLDALFTLLTDPKVLKVVHSARQDLEAIHRRGAVVAGPLFDTQLAASFLGASDQIGYADLVEQRLGIRLPKAHTRTDWSRRPLTSEQRDYALHDVVYLARLYPGLRRELEECGRLAWMLEDQRAVLKGLELSVDPDDAWLRVGQLRRLDGSALSIGQGLAAWRERTAQRDDRPRRWLMSDKVLAHIARSQPTTEQELGKVKDWPRRLRRHYAAQVVDAVRAARDCAVRPGPQALQPDAAQRSMLEQAAAIIRAKAADLGIASSVLARSDDLKAFVCGATTAPFLAGWRRGVIGKDLLELRAVQGAAEANTTTSVV
jgi:ribonuclease D